MPTYVIGDIQGCYQEFRQLLSSIQFDRNTDTLWFTGDLVNRGPQSLEVLRFVSKLNKVICVLGNHDLTLLALAHTQVKIKSHNLNTILSAPDRDELLTWLRGRPLIYHDDKNNYVLVHAGIPPQWTVEQASQYAREVEQLLQGPRYQELLSNMFGNFPIQWDSNLSGWDRYRYIINALTRLRFCDLEGNLDLKYKGRIDEAPSHLVPWFKVSNRLSKTQKILFGHWAALQGQADEPNIFPLDTGCVWGGCLTALRLDDNKIFSWPCSKP